MHVSGRLRVADGAVVAGQPSFGSSFGVGGRTQGALGRWLHVGKREHYVVRYVGLRFR